MPINFLTFEQLRDNGRAELRRRNPQIDPTVFGSFSRPFIDAAALLAYSVQLLVRDLTRELFPQTASGTFLERWAGYEGLTRLPATGSSGFALATGTLATLIPAGSVLTSATGFEYETIQADSVRSQPQSVQSLTLSGTTVTATTNVDHRLATGLDVTISGANESEYNGTFEISVISTTQFTYEITGSPATPATGTISLDATYAALNVLCRTTGEQTNLESGAILTFAQSIPGIDNQATVNANAISGGADLESDELLRQRVLISRRTIEGVFINDQIRLAGLSIPGNTRIFITNPTIRTSDPNAGQPGMRPTPGEVVVYPLRDNDANIIPAQSVLDQTKQAIIERGAMPANTSQLDIYVLAAETVDVDFTFTTLVPDTPTMRTAVNNSLRAFFEDRVQFEGDIFEPQYLSAIEQTIDQNTNQQIQQFELTSPTGTVDINDGQIAVLGNIVYNT